MFRWAVNEREELRLEGKLRGLHPVALVFVILYICVYEFLCSCNCVFAYLCFCICISVQMEVSKRVAV